LNEKRRRRVGKRLGDMNKASDQGGKTLPIPTVRESTKCKERGKLGRKTPQAHLKIGPP